MLVAVMILYLSPRSSAFWVGHDPDVIGPQLHIVEVFGDLLELGWHVHVAGDGLDHVNLSGNFDPGKDFSASIFLLLGNIDPLKRIGGHLNCM